MDDSTAYMSTTGAPNGDAIAFAKSQAIVHGLRTAAICGNIWPNNDDGLSQKIGEELIAELTAFAINARRYLELLGKPKMKADGPLRSYKFSDAKYESDLFTAFNRIVHAKSLNVVWVALGNDKYTNLGDKFVIGVGVVSAQMSPIVVCPQGLLFGLLNPTQLLQK